MSTSHFSGAVDSVGGFSVNGTSVVSSAGVVTSQTSVVVGSTTISEAEIGVLDAVTPGTAAASKALVLNSSSGITTGLTSLTATTVTATNATVTNLTIGATALGSSAAEIDLQCDISLQTETIDVSTACSVTKRITKIASTGAGAVTLAAPGASMLGQVKIIEHISGAHDVTLSLANVTGGSAATTCTFSDDNDALVLVGGTNKWHVIAESGVVLS